MMEGHCEMSRGNGERQYCIAGLSGIACLCLLLTGEEAMLPWPALVPLACLNMPAFLSKFCTT
jgi:hypothetical protein